MKKGICISLLVMLFLILLAVVFLFFRETPVVKEESTYHIVAVTFYSDESANKLYFDEQVLDAMGDQWETIESELLASLVPCTKRRSTELLFSRKGTPVQIPDWMELCVVLVDEEETPTSVLLGNGRGQQRNFIYDPPVYKLSQGEQLCNQWISLLQPVLFSKRNPTQNLPAG